MHLGSGRRYIATAPVYVRGGPRAHRCGVGTRAAAWAYSIAACVTNTYLRRVQSVPCVRVHASSCTAVHTCSPVSVLGGGDWNSSVRCGTLRFRSRHCAPRRGTSVWAQACVVCGWVLSLRLERLPRSQASSSRRESGGAPFGATAWAALGVTRVGVISDPLWPVSHHHHHGSPLVDRPAGTPKQTHPTPAALCVCARPPAAGFVVVPRQLVPPRLATFSKTSRAVGCVRPVGRPPSAKVRTTACERHVQRLSVF